MHTLLHNPWTEESAQLVVDWISQAEKDGVINDNTGVGCAEICNIVDHAEACDMLRDMSLIEAAILLSLYVGRSMGAKNG